MRLPLMLRAALCCMLAPAALCIATPTATPPNPPHAFARGWANLLGGWLEIPRGIVYENTRIPVVGFAAGPVKGAFLAMWRELAGGMDVICFGLTRQGLYTRDVPEFVWDATWIPVCSGTHTLDNPTPPLRRRDAARPAVRPAARVAPCVVQPTGMCAAIQVRQREPRPMPQAQKAGGDAFEMADDAAMDARIEAMEQRVRAMERKAAIFK